MNKGESASSCVSLTHYVLIGQDRSLATFINLSQGASGQELLIHHVGCFIFFRVSNRFFIIFCLVCFQLHFVFFNRVLLLALLTGASYSYPAEQGMTLLFTHLNNLVMF